MKLISTLAVFLGLAGAAFAQDQQLGARTKGMGGSYTAFEDDPVSIWLNPAGIATQPNQLALSYQTYTTYPLSRSKAGFNVDFDAEAETTFVDPAFIPSYLGTVFQIGTGESPMAVGVCYARPYHLNYSFDQLEDPLKTDFVPDTNIEESFSRFRVAFAKDFRLKTQGETGFFTRLAAGIGLDVGYEQWEFESDTESLSDNSTALGYGFGLLAVVYDNADDFKVNLGLAFQSAIRWHFSNDPVLFPAFDMPMQLNVGLTGYFLKGMPLRVTLDLQWVEWSKTAEEPAFPDEEFRNAVNVSLGLEYRFKVTDKMSLYTRTGYRRFMAPWEDEDDLPLTSSYKLLVDTEDDTFNIYTLGLGLSITDEKGRLWVIDLGADFGGDAFNVAIGFTYEI